MYIPSSRNNNYKYEIYNPGDDYSTNASGEYSEDLVGNIYGTRPQIIEKANEASALMGFKSPASFMIVLKKPTGLKKGYVLKSIKTSLKYRIINDPVPFNDTSKFEAIVEHIQ
jgi:hypothetical protein